MYRRQRVAHSICFSHFDNLNFKGLQSVINKINITEICVVLIHIGVCKNLWYGTLHSVFVQGIWRVGFWFVLNTHSCNVY